jgi:predicted RNase H-like HicB family nuclease
MTNPPDAVVFPVALEEGPDGATLVHSLSVPGCVAGGATQEEALAAFPGVLAAWLRTLESTGERVPPRDAELEITVDEWVTTEADVAAGESRACFEWDLQPATPGDIARDLRRLGDLRGLLLREIRRRPDAELDHGFGGEWTARRAIEELARAQWWTLSRLGASPLAELPDHTVGRLDTAMALIISVFSEMEPEARARVLDLEGETWTARKVLRRLLWLEWTLGRVARAALLKP